MKLLQKLSSTLFTLVVIVMMFLAYGSVNNRWYRVVAVHGNSMAPTLWYGDLMVITPAVENIPVNTIVVMDADGSLVTHRLIGYDEAGRIITQGDANETPDVFNNPNIRIIGICRARLPGLGYPLLMLSNLLNSA
jgi:signal peptidase